MASKLVFFALSLALLFIGSLAKGYSTTGLSSAQQCRLRRITADQPSDRIEHEGGVTEFWNEEEEQFQCAGVVALRNILRPNSLFLPTYQPAPHLIYIKQGRGLLGMVQPGCAETYQSDPSSAEGRPRWREGEEQQERGGRFRDQHQKVHRIRRGDIIAIPQGAVHWCANDGNEDLVAVSISDLKNQANQLDQNFRAFSLAGGLGRQQGGRGQGRFNFQNILSAFDEELLAEAFNTPVDLVRQLQQNDNRGVMVNLRERLRMIAPDVEEDEEEEEEEEEEYMRGERRRSRRGGGPQANGLEETLCTMKIKQNIDPRREADVHSRQAGRINIVNMQKLPLLRWLDMSAERGTLRPNALYSPHWSMTDHRVVYVIRGDARIQIVGQNGDNIFDERVNEGQLFVIPQFFATVARAGNNGFEWVTFKTSGQPMKSPLAGYTSVFRGLPLEVITNSYQISPRDAQELKYNREQQTFLLSPTKRSLSQS